MLVEFRLRNFRCFRDEQVLSLVASSSKRLPENLITDVPNLGHNLLRSIAIYGPNASGKTTVLDALNLVQTLVRTSARGKPEDKVPVEPFLLDPKTRDAPSWFEITFIHEAVRYQYGFEADFQRIYAEYLYATPHGRTAMLFEREYDSSTGIDTYQFGPSLHGQRAKVKEATRHNALFLSVAASLNQKDLSVPYQWIAESLTGIQAHIMGQEGPFIVDESLHSEISLFLQAADLGIVDYKLERETDAGEYAVVMKQRSTRANGSKGSGRIFLLHGTQDKDTVPFVLDAESNGTVHLFAMASLLIAVLQGGHTLYIDELDASLHPALVRNIVERFHHLHTGRSNAQLIFNTHDTTLMDADLFRPDQIWFTEKDSDGAAHLYSLLKFRPREDASLAKGYLQGRYGAIPFLGEPAMLSAQEER